MCFPVQISQVFLNVLANAIDAVDKSGLIIIATRSTENAIEIKITDNGIGMTPEVMERIFEPMYTTKEANQGTGLGLSITMDIIKNHDGTIKVKSEINKGTTFIISLPLVEE